MTTKRRNKSLEKKALLRKSTGETCVAGSVGSGSREEGKRKEVLCTAGMMAAFIYNGLAGRPVRLQSWRLAVCLCVYWLTLKYRRLGCSHTYIYLSHP